MSIEVTVDHDYVIILVGDIQVCGMTPDIADYIADELRRVATIISKRQRVEVEEPSGNIAPGDS